MKFRLLKTVLLIFGLVAFVLPKQTLYAQTAGTEFCDHSKGTMDCCSKKAEDCHSEQPAKSSKGDCKDDCTRCQTCTMFFSLTFDGSVTKLQVKALPFTNANSFGYKAARPTSTYFNIWQPPKIA